MKCTPHCHLLLRFVQSNRKFRLCAAEGRLFWVVQFNLYTSNYLLGRSPAQADIDQPNFFSQHLVVQLIDWWREDCWTATPIFPSRNKCIQCQ
jgi:hypothetical protein